MPPILKSELSGLSPYGQVHRDLHHDNRHFKGLKYEMPSLRSGGSFNAGDLAARRRQCLFDKIDHAPTGKWFPLKVLVCESCWLVQAEPFAGGGIV